MHTSLCSKTKPELNSAQQNTVIDGGAYIDLVNFSNFVFIHSLILLLLQPSLKSASSTEYEAPPPVLPDKLTPSKSLESERLWCCYVHIFCTWHCDVEKILCHDICIFHFILVIIFAFFMHVWEVMGEVLKLVHSSNVKFWLC